VQQVKIFKGLEHETDVLEKQVNDWIRSSKSKIVHIFGNIAPQTARAEASPISGAARTMGHRFGTSDVLLVVLYESA